MEGSQFLTSRTVSAEVGDTQIMYIGLAYPGSLESDAVWMIQRIAVNSDDSTITLFAAGSAKFNQVWADREHLIYS